MKQRSTFPFMLLVIAGYVLLIWVIMYYMAPPWNWAVASMVVMKGLIYWAIMGKAARIGRTRRAPRP